MNITNLAVPAATALQILSMIFVYSINNAESGTILSEDDQNRLLLRGPTVYLEETCHRQQSCALETFVASRPAST